MSKEQIMQAAYGPKGYVAPREKQTASPKQKVVMKREPLSADQVREVYRTAFPKGPYVYTNDAFVFARMIEKAHGIGVNHE